MPSLSVDPIPNYAALEEMSMVSIRLLVSCLPLPWKSECKDVLTLLPGVRFDDPASGFANLGLLADPENFLCFVLQFIKFVAPTFTNNLFADLFGMLGTTVASVGCPEIPDLTRGAFTFLEDLRQKYPGAALSGVGW